MTLGQRIQAERKRLGLSQEGLGEALGVTRQAISKWEADGAVPEVDKLVALSRLFHLPVGVLLGVEEAAAAEPPRPVPRWKRRLWPLLSAALGAVCVVLLLRVNTLQSGQADRLLAAALADGRMWQVEERGVAALEEGGTFRWRLRAAPEMEAPGLGLSVTAEGAGKPSPPGPTGTAWPMRRSCTFLWVRSTVSRCGRPSPPARSTGRSWESGP